MLAFAGNSLLCRAALRHTPIDAASFTLARIASGALALSLIVQLRSRSLPKAGNWGSAVALFAYAALFSLAYLSLAAGTGALLLFGAVQATMILGGMLKGERLRFWQTMGLTLALGGLVALVLPGISAPPLTGAILMLTAGMAWGIYSLRGRSAGDPVRATAGNFLRAVPLAIAFSLITLSRARFGQLGLIYAIVSGAITSGIGYAIWYAALPALSATGAATVQLSVPVLAAAGGILLLGESLTLRLLGASIAVLGGITLVLRTQTRAK